MSSGARRSSSRFALDDIYSMVSKSKAIKKEKGEPAIEVLKPDAPTPRYKINIGKKRKLCDAADVAIYEGLDYVDAYKKLHVLSHLGLEQMTRCYESVVKAVEKVFEQDDDATKTRPVSCVW
ncbi:hypothetical protein L1987_20269 [Smallanthus sonchifolius]|uniref:Uncharacterized protein n=1 Tax=Smallanthus sonchifolius TaxID=185202 RepID=A0ACB9IS34_9ASTR|nr:hypothetical protein L1987_20269 [Smallanthus sonchifolius]